MFVRRCLRSVAAAFGLAVILLAAYAAQVQSGPLAQEPEPYRYYFPIINVQRVVTLQGTVTNSTAAAAGETILVMVSRNGGATFSEYARAATNAGGGYQFIVPIQGTNDRYYAAWKNTSNDDRKLWSFTCAVQTSTTANRTCDFNIQNIAMIAPAPGSSVNFPVTFQWTPRSTNTDSYAVTIYNDDANKTLRVRSDYVGYTDRTTLAAAPPGSVVGARYYWSVRVQTPSGLGDAYYLYPLFYRDLTSLQPNLLSGPGWVEGLEAPLTPRPPSPEAVEGGG